MSLARSIGSATAVGRVRNHNEDGLIADDRSGIFAVADGMGGHRGGEVASKTALEALEKALKGGTPIGNAVVIANRAVYDRSSKNNDLHGMGTTLTAGIFDRAGKCTIAHVGDSRAYLVRNKALKRITTDHSLMAELIAAGQLTEAEAEVDPRRSMITRALGLDPTVEVDLQDLQTLGGDRVMFCSDGLTSMMRDPAIVAVLNEEPEPQLAAQRLIDEANKAGGVDNITVVIVDLAQGDDSETAQTENTSRRRWFRRQA